MLPFLTYITFNFVVCNNANEALTIREKLNRNTGNSEGFLPSEYQRVAGRGGEGGFKVIKLLADM